jgi:proline iminopeptidase
MPLARLDDTELFYVEVGEGLPCLVMHGGLGFDHTGLHPWLDALGDVMRLVYYDHRSNGRSGRPPSETITFERLCSDADALRGHLGFEEVCVLGCSFGGFVALEYALRYPERISHLILLDTAPALDYSDEIEANARRKGATDEQLEAIAASAEDEAEFWRLWKLIEPLYFHTYDADLAERVMVAFSCCGVSPPSVIRRGSGRPAKPYCSSSWRPISAALIRVPQVSCRAASEEAASCACHGPGGLGPGY